MTHGSLFSGIGGFDLAAEWMGWENKFHCEWNEFGQRVLHHYWPNAELFTDITKSDFTKYANTIDVLTGGFPCQPYSAAGKRLGKEDERHLWPQMCRAIREIAPRYVVGENVRGLTNWNGGLVFDEVCADLENLGYQVAPFIIPACAANAPHKRERIWFIAYAQGRGRGKQPSENSRWEDRRFNNDAQIWNATDSNHERLQRGSVNGSFRAIWSERNEQPAGCVPSNWEIFPTQSPVCGGDDGLPTELDGITFSKWRTESIKAYGNAIVPQVVYQIFKSIEAYERTLHTNHLGGHALCYPGMDGETDTCMDVVPL
jgi:DNA (cytosine-5)-methyltransferase 1